MPSKFLKVKCTKCKNEQIIFEKPAMEVRCLVCGEILASTTGGRGVVKTKVMGVMK